MELCLTWWLCLAYGMLNEWMSESEEPVISSLTPEALDARKWTHGFEIVPDHAETALNIKKNSSCLSLCIWIKQSMAFSWSLGHRSLLELRRKMTGKNDSDVVISIKLSFGWLMVQWKFFCWCTYPLACLMVWSSHYSAQKPSCEAPSVSSSSICLCVSWHLC